VRSALRTLAFPTRRECETGYAGQWSGLPFSFDPTALRNAIETRHISCIASASTALVQGERGGFPRMAQLIEREALDRTHRGERDKALKILAKSIFRELKTNGYSAREIVSLSTELLSLITTEIKPDPQK
jgi:hypothetical protein